MILELEKEKVSARFSLQLDLNYSPISRYEQIPKEDQEDLISGDAAFFAISVEANCFGEVYHFVSQGMIMSLDEEDREEEFEAFVSSEGGLFDDIITKLKVWTNEIGDKPRWSK